MSEAEETYPWQDAFAVAVDVGARVQQVAIDHEHGALARRLGAFGTVVGYVMTRALVLFDGDDEPVTLRSGALAVVAPTAARETEVAAASVPGGDGAGTPELFPQSFAARRTSGGMQARETHLFPIPDPAAGVPAALRAYCGVSIRPGEAEMLSTVFTGAPCMGCLVCVSSGTTS